MNYFECEECVEKSEIGQYGKCDRCMDYNFYEYDDNCHEEIRK